MKRVKNVLRKSGLFCLLIAAIVIMGIYNPRFLSLMNFVNLAQRMAFVGIVACGMTFVIITGGIDLSVGSVQAISAFIMAKLFAIYGLPLGISIVVTLVICTILGIVSGTLISRARIPAFIVTLGFLQTYRALSEVINQAQPIGGIPRTLSWWVIGRAFGIFPPIFLIWVGIVLVFWFIEKRLRLGRYMFVIGGNAEAGQLSGINIRAYNVIPYLLTSLLAALSGVMMAGKLTAAIPEVGQGFELDVIAAVCIGGVSLMGGRGTMMQVVLGVIFLTVLNNVTVIIGFNDFQRQILTGVFILIAVAVSNLGSERKILPVA